MPYILTGYDSAGLRHEYTVDDSGAVSGDDDLLSGWLGANAFEKPEPVAGEAQPESGALTPSQLDALRQHVSKILTTVVIQPQPQAGEHAAPTDLPTGTTGSTTTSSSTPYASSSSSTVNQGYTSTELNAMTVTDLRTMATTAGISGASSMTKAELVTALLAQQGS